MCLKVPSKNQILGMTEISVFYLLKYVMLEINLGLLTYFWSLVEISKILMSCMLCISLMQYSLCVFDCFRNYFCCHDLPTCYNDPKAEFWFTNSL